MPLANIESHWSRLVQVPRHLHLKRHDDPMEDIDKEEEDESLDPEYLCGSEERNFVPAELQKVEPCQKIYTTIFSISKILHIKSA